MAGGVARGLIAVGLACVAGAFRGRQRALMVVGVALTVVLALGEEEGGFASKVETTAEAGGDRRLELDLRVGLGQVRVER